MIHVDHYYVIIAGLLLVGFFYRVSLYTLLAIAGCGMVAYVWRQRNLNGWRIALGYDDGFYGFICRPKRRGRRRTSSDHQQCLDTVLDDLMSAHQCRGPTPAYSVRSQNCTISDSTTPSRFRLHDTSGTVLNRLPFSQQTISPWGMEQQSFQTTATTPEAKSSGPKHLGIGAYPHIQLEPRRPTILSYCNSNMMKNRVTVKVALPVDKMSGCNMLPLPLAGTGSSLSSSSSKPQADCTSVIEALQTNRKRPIKDDEHVNLKRRFCYKDPCFDDKTPTSSPHLPTEITQHFESQLSNESLAILMPQESTTKKTGSAQIQASSSSSSSSSSSVSLPMAAQPSLRPRMFARAKTNAIESSYSSSFAVPVSHDRFGVPFYRGVENRSAKRKSEASSNDAPETKMSRESNSDVPITNANVDQSNGNSENLENETSPNLESEAHVEDDDKDAKKVPVKIGTHLNFHVPNYIPSLEDHLEDQRADQKRLEKLLGFFSNSAEKQQSTCTDQPDSHKATSGLLPTTVQQPVINTDSAANGQTTNRNPPSSSDGPKTLANLLPDNSSTPLTAKTIGEDVSSSAKTTQPMTAVAVRPSATSPAEGAAAAAIATYSFPNGIPNAAPNFNAGSAFAIGSSVSPPNGAVQMSSPDVAEAPPQPAAATTALSLLPQPPITATEFSRSNGDGSMPSFGNNNISVSAVGAGAINGMSATTATPGFQFSFGAPSTGAAGGVTTLSTTAVNPGFNFGAIGAPPTINFAGASTTPFTPIAKQPVSVTNMFSIGPSNSPVSSRRSKQTLQRHRSSHR